MSENACFLPMYLSSTLAGRSTLGLPSFWSEPFHHCDLECCHGGPRAAWPMVICFLCLDYCGLFTSLLNLNYLIRTCHGVENSELIFLISGTAHIVDSVLPAFQTVLRIIQYFLHSLFFHSIFWFLCISSVQFSHSVMSDSLRPHELQHARPPCPSPTPGVYPNSYPLSWWCHPTISSSVVPFSSCLQFFPTSGSFKWVSSLHQVAKILEFQLQHQSSNEHPGPIFRMDWLDLLAVQGTLKSLLQHHSSKASILRCSTFLIVQLSHGYMTTGKTIALTRRTFIDKVMSLLFNMLFRLVRASLPGGKCLLISWLQSPSAVILETK